MFHVPNEYRITDHPILASTADYGNNGAFKIPMEDKYVIAFCIASDGQGWEHVSVHITEQGKNETPVWDEMCWIKNLFWDEDDCVIQYHPPKSEYVNNHKNTLHLWRPTELKIPMPPSILVGVK